MVLAYCQAAGLDPMQKPVHIVPLWDARTNAMRDVVMPGIGLYRIIAARTGEYAGISAPEFGPIVDETLDGVRVHFPQWCSITVRRRRPDGGSDEFTACEFWRENYATKSRNSAAPNAMWQRRPFGQLAKCAEAQALRKAFPEVGAAPTADEMQGKSLADGAIDSTAAAVNADADSAELRAALDRLENAPDTKTLQREFRAAWVAFPNAQTEIAAAKDRRKKTLAAQALGWPEPGADLAATADAGATVDAGAA
jgi:phage recombination protein Bet